MRYGWEIKRLEELCNIARGGSPRPIKQFLTDAADGVNWIKISDASASSKYIYETKEKIKPAGIKRSRIVRENDFLLSNSMSFGRPYIMKTTGCIHDGWLVLKDKSGLFDQNYLYHFLGSGVAYKQFESRASGSTVRNLNIDLVKSVEVVLPPLPEQRRIVAILDEALAAIATATANAKKNLAHAQELFESELNRVFTQRGDGWVEKRLGDICILRNGRAYKKSELLEKGKYRVLRVGNFFTNKNWFYSDLELDVTKYCAEGDLLYAWSASFGPRIWNDGKVIYHYHIWRVDPNELVTKDFLYRWLAWDAEKIKAEHGAGTTMIHVSKASMEARVLHLPPISEQKVIIDNFRKLEKETRRLESIYQQKLALLAELKQSLLHKAFSGELRTNAKPVEKSLTEMGK